jgi:hypothetical protein
MRAPCSMTWHTSSVRANLVFASCRAPDVRISSHSMVAATVRAKRLRTIGPPQADRDLTPCAIDDCSSDYHHTRLPTSCHNRADRSLPVCGPHRDSAELGREDSTAHLKQFLTLLKIGSMTVSNTGLVVGRGDHTGLQPADPPLNMAAEAICHTGQHHLA